ncbi:hypothetical protein N7530_011309 [Penicillium desertorum]|uniref:Uncharacterized protein n=1 Tax=Penicillium desertorum TaxID=1303715 RepID=A0A9X0BHI7_9EURO|nr:hypothetical protein N7530_011309 [Penicillium desertorum]
MGLVSTGSRKWVATTTYKPTANKGIRSNPQAASQQAYYAHEVEISANSVTGAPLTLPFVTVYDILPQKERETLSVQSRISWLSLVICFVLQLNHPWHTIGKSISNLENGTAALFLYYAYS